MPDNPTGYQDAIQDFTDARFKASMQEMLARLTGKSNELLSYEEVADNLYPDCLFCCKNTYFSDKLLATEIC